MAEDGTDSGEEPEGDGLTESAPGSPEEASKSGRTESTRASRAKSFATETRSRITSNPRVQAISTKAMAVARDERTKQVVKTAATAASLAVVGELSRRLSQQPGVRAGVAAQLLKRVSDDRGDARTKRALAEPVSGSDSDSSPEEVVAGDSAWSAPAWLPPKSSEPDTQVIGAPLEFYMTKAELQRVEKHPRIPSLYIEATRVDPAGPALAIDWEPVVNPRVFYSVQQIPRAWTAVRHDEHLVPMELRSDESGHIWCRWLEPSLTDRQIQRENPYVPMDPAAVERRIREGLRAAAKSTPRWHV